MDDSHSGSLRAALVGLDWLVGGSPGLEPQVPGVQPHGADSGCAAEKSPAESGDLLHGGNSGGLVEGLALVPHDEKAEVQGGCGV